MDKRVLFFGLAFMTWSTSILAQSLCQSFDDSIVSSASDIAHTFYYHRNGWLNHWQVTDGTPSVEPSGNLGGIIAYDGNQYATIGVCGGGNGSDGVELLFHFVAHQTYTVSFADRNWNSYQSVMQYYLLPVPFTHTYDSLAGCSRQYYLMNPDSLGGKLVFTSTPPNSWTLESFTFTTDTDYESLWLSVSSPASIPDGSGAEYCLDSFCVNPVAKSTGFCQSFDDSTVNSSSDIAHTFYYHSNGWLSHWEVTDGTPSVEPSGSLSGINAYDGNQYATIGVCGGGNGSDGVEFLYNFLTGHSYKISFADRNWNSYQTVMQYYLLPVPFTHTYDSLAGCSRQYYLMNPDSLGGKLVFTSTPPNQWTLESFTFTVDSNYESLWLSVSSPASIPDGSGAEYCLDSFCVNDITPEAISPAISFETIALKNIPNPFSNYTSIICVAPVGFHTIYVAITDIAGRRVATYPVAKSGLNSIAFYSGNLGDGVYIYTLIADGKPLVSKKMVIGR